jgi:hypothetical protein
VNDKSERLNFSGQNEARGKQLAPGTWTFYPTVPSRCSGVVVFLK